MQETLMSRESIQERAQELFEESRQKIFRETDRLFVNLMIVQWLAAIAAAIWISPYTWIGTTGQVHWDVLVATYLGGFIALFPIYLALSQPGSALTRHTIAVAQMLFSVLLIHLTGGRIETHFHIFGSLAFLAFYRDARVLLLATAIVAVDHFARGLFWPQSVFGVLSYDPWRWLEHVGWVIFEDVFLLISIRRGLEEMFEGALRRANLEEVNVAIEYQVAERTKDLENEQKLLRALMDNLPDHIYFKDAQSHFIRINQAQARFFSLGDPEEAIGKSDINFFPFEAARQKVMDERRIFMTGEPIVNLVERADRPNGERWVSTTKVPMCDAEGRITGLVGISRDITTVKQAEEHKRSLEAKLNQAHKLEAIGQLAAGIAHEINTPTQYVGDNARFVQDGFATVLEVLHSHETLLAAARDNSLTPDQIAAAEKLIAASDLDYLSEQIPAAISQTLEGVDRITKIVRAMKEYSHPGSQEKTAADLNRAVQSTATLAHNEWKYVADLEFDLSPDIPAVPCFLGEFNQCVLNLIVNASHAIADVVQQQPGTKGLITISTRHAGDYVEVRVRDTGTGIPESAQPHIFEQFFTTKDVGKGTGQGLSMIYGCIVNKHGGEVGFETKPGRGTTFFLRLPITPSGRASKPQSAPAPELAEPVCA